MKITLIGMSYDYMRYMLYFFSCIDLVIPKANKEGNDRNHVHILLFLSFLTLHHTLSQ